MNTRFLEGTSGDIDDAFLWYEDQVVGLGYAFLAAVTDAVSLVEAHPVGFPVGRGVLRRCSLIPKVCGLQSHPQGLQSAVCGLQSDPQGLRSAVSSLSILPINTL